VNRSRPQSTHHAPGAQLIWTLAQVGGLWVSADLGFYFLLPVLDVQPSYNDSPVAITLYYTFWLGFAVIVFWPVYATWPDHARWSTFSNRLTSAVVWSISFVGCILFAGYVLPLLPPTNWTEPWDPPEVRLATSWYFLPKSIEILFQQLLVIALVLALAKNDLPLGKISIYCAIVFGAAHVLLALGGAPPGYVIRFSLAAALFGLVFPYLILRVSNGLAYAYVVHWLYYAATVTMAHVVSSYAK
jgi:hypothetical protein